MTCRSLMLGTLLALAVASLTYFNDQIVRQTFLINHHLPAPVFGAGILLLLLVNPVLGRFKLARPFGLGEVGVILALGLAVCAWPGTSYFRYFTHMFVLPAFHAPVEPAWQTHQVLAYVPGEHGRLGAGYLRDPDALQQRLRQATPTNDPLAHRFADQLAGPARARLGRLDAAQLAGALQRVLETPDLADAAPFEELALGDRTHALLDAHRRGDLGPDRVPYLNRRLLEATFADTVIPLRRGRGVLPAEGELVPALVDPLLAPTGTGRPTLSVVPWQTWGPTLGLWGGATLLTALAVLCLMVLVHPQWSRRELLSYPSVQLVQELARPGPAGPWPAMMSNRLFWAGFGAVVTLHTLNGLHAWFPAVPAIARQFDLGGLGTLFPNASRVTGFWGLVHPTLYPAAIGMAFLIPTRIAFSVGLALPLWILFNALLLGAGVSVSNHRNVPESMGPSLRFGAFVGLTVTILYFGRYYYLAVARAAAMLPSRSTVVPGYASWAARGLVLFSALASLLLWRYAGVEWWLAAMVLAMVLMTSLVLARLNAEAGLFYVQPDWYPIMMMLAFLGVPALGPELLIVLLIASFLLMPEPREGLAPFLINALRLADPQADHAPRRRAPLIGMVMVGGFVVALGVTFALQYHYGLNMHDHWAPRQGHQVFEPVAAAIAELRAREELTISLEHQGLERLRLAQPTWPTVGWMAVGLGLVLAFVAANLRLTWWPLHPVLLVIWGTWPSYSFGISFLVGAAVKWSVIKLAGERGFHIVKPAMIGLIAGDLIMILIWAAVGVVYFLTTGRTPESYFILPN